VQDEIEEYERRGVAVVAIGQGTGEEASHYFDKWGVRLPGLGDPKGVAYRAFGMLRGSWWTILFRSLVTQPVETLSQIAKADMSGAQLAAADVLRLGGVAIVEKGGTLRFLHRAEEPADIPPNSEVLAALDKM